MRDAVPIDGDVVRFVQPMSFSTSIAIHRGNVELQDRAEILDIAGQRIFVIADGAGGISGGTEAAEWLMKRVREVGSLKDSRECCRLLDEIDQKLNQSADCGETTGIIVVAGDTRLFGASVGDSAAWFFFFDGKEELTRGQTRKPLLGSGASLPHSFVRALANGILVIATDGLWKYANLDLIEQRVRNSPADVLASQLAELARLRSGGFPDDIAIITCEFT